MATTRKMAKRGLEEQNSNKGQLPGEKTPSATKKPRAILKAAPPQPPKRKRVCEPTEDEALVINTIKASKYRRIIPVKVPELVIGERPVPSYRSFHRSAVNRRWQSPETAIEAVRKAYRDLVAGAAERKTRLRWGETVQYWAYGWPSSEDSVSEVPATDDDAGDDLVKANNKTGLWTGFDPKAEASTVSDAPARVGLFSKRDWSIIPPTSSEADEELVEREKVIIKEVFYVSRDECKEFARDFGKADANRGNG
jgi:hypothetical protein